MKRMPLHVGVPEQDRATQFCQALPAAGAYC